MESKVLRWAPRYSSLGDMSGGEKVVHMATDPQGAYISEGDVINALVHIWKPMDGGSYAEGALEDLGHILGIDVYKIVQERRKDIEITR